MGLTPGTRLGPYAIGDQIGVGGMGEVYRATDTNLGRDVAIKVLPEAFAQDAERLARFEREARTLAALNHPNIAIIHGLERGPAEAGHYVQALVMELVEGPTLADEIQRRAGPSGPAGLPLDEALSIARQIAEALEAAHEQGVIHRDLKPANVKVRDDGTVKVLDFGLAKMVSPAEAGHYVGDRSVRLQPDLSLSPTITTPAMTQLGMILGTAAYMAPEQAKGKPADKRSDVWAFGCVLYEMLTGKRAFAGEDVGDTLAAVIRGEPDWTALPRELPASIRSLLKQCLEKNRRTRVPDLAVARFLMNDANATVAAPTVDVNDARGRRWIAIAIGALAGTVLTVLVGWGVWRLMPAQPAEPARFAIMLPPPYALENTVAQDIAISPDARHIVYAVTVKGVTQLAIRPIDDLEARLLAGTEGGSSPFFSHDGRWIGYFTNVGGGGGELKKVPTAGGPPLTVCRYRGNAAGASWGSDDSIVFATTDLTTGLFRVPPAGGEPAQLTTPDRARDEIDHRFPFVLPGADAVLYSLAKPDSYEVAVLELETGKRRSLLPSGRNAQYVDSGHLVYAVEQTLRAVGFDRDSLAVTSEPVPVLQDVRIEQAVLAAADFSVSRNGALVYVPGGPALQEAMRTLVWVTREGVEEAIKAPPRTYFMARLSPDGRKVALDVREAQADIWIWDFDRENFSRLTSDQTNDRNPVWTPDGERILFASNRSAGALSLFWQRADGIGQADLVATATGFMVPTSVSPDGTRVAVMENLDLALVTLDPKVGGPRRSEPLFATAYAEDNAEISPDGSWVAFQSAESGQSQIYVRSFPDIERFRMQVTTAGGRAPAWSRDRRELFYLDANNMLTSVAVQMGSTFSAGKPARVLSRAYFPGFGNRAYDVSRDGRRFLMIKQSAAESGVASPDSLVVVLNWSEELKRLLPQ